MKRTKITLELNLDEVTILGAAVIHAVRNGWNSEVIKTMYPNADMADLMEQIAIARDEVEIFNEEASNKAMK